MQRQILINVMIFFAYALNLPLNTQRPHHRSQRAGKLGLDFGSWQSPDISRSHLYRGTFPWTPPTAIYRAYTVPQSCTRWLVWLSIQIGHVTLVAITGTTILVSYLYVKSLQLLWRLGTGRFHLRVPNLHMSCRELITWQGTRIVAPGMAAGQHVSLSIALLPAYLLPVVRVSISMETSWSLCSDPQFSYTTPRPLEAMSWVNSGRETYAEISLNSRFQW